MRETSEATWQGVALPELEYNRRLERGPDFGGECTARYQPAVERYDGRFFLGLGVDRADALRASRHHLLLLSGLYGVLRPFEPIQLYSCRLVSGVARVWREGGVLTDVINSYEAHAIESVGEVLGGGNPEPSAGGRSSHWRFAAMPRFRRDVWREPRLFERVANAIVEICKDPMTPRGNTIRRLTRDMSGFWRYRLGDFRLVYRPDNDRLTVYCHRLAPRGGVYD